MRFLRLLRLLRGTKKTRRKKLQLTKKNTVHRLNRILDSTPTFKSLMLRMDSRKLHMIRLVVVLLLIEHWAACIWVWIGREEVLLDKGRYTWIDRLTQNGFIFDPSSELDLYVVALYWGEQ